MEYEITLCDNILTAGDYTLFQQKMGWNVFPKEQAEKSFANQLFSVAAVRDAEIIGMGRLLGDGAIYWYINDVFVLNQYQGMGVGRKIVERLIRYVKENSPRNSSVSIYLFCANHNNAFYEKFGFTNASEYESSLFVMDLDI